LLKKFPPNDLTDSDEKALHQRVAIDIAGDFKVNALQPALLGFLQQGSTIGMGIRAAALRSLLKIDVKKNAAIGGDILQNDSLIEYQRRIAAVLSEFPGSVMNKMLDNVKKIPTDLQGAIVVALAGSGEGKDILFKKIKRGELLPRTLLDPRAEERVLMNASPKQQKEFEEITANLDPISKEKQDLIEQRLFAFDLLDKKSLSLDSGRMSFEQNCGVCHKAAGVGVAPQLNGIGKTGAHGLVEKILDPNRNISQAFKNYSIKLKDGTVKSGLYRREEGGAKVFADITGKEFSVSTKDIAEQKVSKYTLMPDTFGSTIAEREFYNLVNYLSSL
jgi:putative heme-binding domain-containing protein